MQQFPSLGFFGWVYIGLGIANVAIAMWGLLRTAILGRWKICALFAGWLAIPVLVLLTLWHVWRNLPD
ncbi:MAG: hypothetical protein ABSH20_00900 [Tepidisphaeraceae bacterium]|jgi:hypothetical protein